MRRLQLSHAHLFRDCVQRCSGLLDLVVWVGHHGGGVIVARLAGERFVGLAAEDIAWVGDRGGDFQDRRCGEGVSAEPGDGGRRFLASEPVEKNGEPNHGDGRAVDADLKRFFHREGLGRCHGVVPGQVARAGVPSPFP